MWNGEFYLYLAFEPLKSAPITTHLTNHAYLINGVGDHINNNILTNTVHVFQKVLPDYIIIIPIESPFLKR